MLWIPGADGRLAAEATEPAEATEAAPTEAPSATEAGDAGAGVLLARLQETQPPPTEAATEPAQPMEAVTEATTEAPAADTEPPAPTDASDAIKQLTENQQIVDTPVKLASSIINAFTSLVAVVIGFYFSTRSIDYYNKLQALSKAPELLARFLDEEQ